MSPVKASQKAQNESYFEELGKQNSTRPDHLPPSQGGKYQGFGSAPISSNNNNNNNNNGGTITLEKLQTDPLGTISKGWGMFASALSKTVDDVQQNVIKPHVDQYQNGELQEEAYRAAQQFGQKFQQTSSYGIQALSSFTKNIQDQYVAGSHTGSSGEESKMGKLFDNMTPRNTQSDKNTTKKDEDNWDDF